MNEQLIAEFGHLDDRAMILALWAELAASQERERVLREDQVQCRKIAGLARLYYTAAALVLDNPSNDQDLADRCFSDLFDELKREASDEAIGAIRAALAASQERERVLRRDVEEMYHAMSCPFDHCERCIREASRIKRIGEQVRADAALSTSTPEPTNGE